jgi:hypothetical protein
VRSESAVRVAITVSWIAIACTPTRRFDQIEAPSYWWTVDDGECGQTMVVDKNRAIWREGGCQSSPGDLVQKSELSEGEFRKLVASYDSFPASKSFSTCKGVEHQFRRVRGSNEEAWAACVDKGKGKDPSALPEPYKSAAMVFNAARGQ